MPYYFFFSYSRDNNDDYLKQFFQDLSEKICELLGIDKKTKVGFFDQGLQLGDDWGQLIEHGLQTAPVLVSLYSPAYFNSEFCGKEWECFFRRQQLFIEKAKAAGKDASSPSVIKPVIWTPMRRNQSPPPRVSKAQYTAGDPNAPHNTVGLREMRRWNDDNGRAYDAFIADLANQILDTLEPSLPAGKKLLDWLELEEPIPDGLPPLDPFPAWEEIDSAFDIQQVQAVREPAGSRALLSRRTVGPKFVRFVIVAAHPTEFPKGERQPDFYLQNGGSEWKPYFPDLKHTLLSVAQGTAADMGLHSDELPFDQNLPATVRQVETAKSMVIVFVDCWTAELPGYANVLRVVDRKKYLNCSIFIPWNEKDPETKARQEQFKKTLRNDIFPRWAGMADLGESIFYCDSINSVEGLRGELQVTLTKLQCLIGKDAIEHATSETVPRRVPSEISKPVLSHKDPVNGGTG